MLKPLQLKMTLDAAILMHATPPKGDASFGAPLTLLLSE
jgi:hypothetical protein